MAETSRELVRTIGRWSLVALMVNSIIGAGVFGLPSVVAAKLGPWSAIGCLAAGAGMLLIAACFAEVSSQFDGTGGVYLYARAAFGRFVSLIVAWLIWLTRVVATAAAADLFATYAAQFFPVLAGPIARPVLLGILVGQLALFNYVGVKVGNTVSNFFTVAKVGFLLFFAASGIAMLVLHPAIRVPSATAATVPFSQWLAAFLVLVYAYGGFEGALFVGGETKNPKRDYPIALLLALAVVCLIYTAVQYVVMATLPNPGAASRPLADAAEHFLGPAGAAMIGIGALISTYGYLSANLLHTPRITFALAEQGDFPKFLAAVHPKFRTPYASIILYAVLLYAFAWFGSFRWNAVLSAVSRLTVYGVIALAVPVLRRKQPNAERFRLPMPYLFAGAGMLFAFTLLTRMGRGEFLIVGGTVAVAVVHYFTAKR